MTCAEVEYKPAVFATTQRRMRICVRERSRLQPKAHGDTDSLRASYGCSHGDKGAAYC